MQAAIISAIQVTQQPAIIYTNTAVSSQVTQQSSKQTHSCFITMQNDIIFFFTLEWEFFTVIIVFWYYIDNMQIRLMYSFVVLFFLNVHLSQFYGQQWVLPFFFPHNTVFCFLIFGYYLNAAEIFCSIIYKMYCFIQICEYFAFNHHVKI